MNPANANLQYTGEGLTEQFEGCGLTPYRDVNGLWTNGYGNTHGVVPGQTITQEQAEADLLRNIQWACTAVKNLVKIALTQDEFNALVDFVFNVGSGNFENSTMLRFLNAGLIAQAADQFTRWDEAGGVVVAGLLRRRIAEQNEFNGSPA